ncbi:unnamed protein product [Vitrella brassicaformis CCMP3155]|uniref:Oxidation resistance protein 1 n=1 Tax=Vitrella brassicaformis (strain CCMP3155) TaxID=1169540 RepID=A0A0G4EQL6_VITBC|nr:unnamed protein product [Vitrella brassicaformis CCMP3155]|eukprot:CEL99528.1 unnamed protein product [Vitrella brassicaformis CCMP3155]
MAVSYPSPPMPFPMDGSSSFMAGSAAPPRPMHPPHPQLQPMALTLQPAIQPNASSSAAQQPTDDEAALAAYEFIGQDRSESEGPAERKRPMLVDNLSGQATPSAADDDIRAGVGRGSEQSPGRNTMSVVHSDDRRTARGDRQPKIRKRDKSPEFKEAPPSVVLSRYTPGSRLSVKSAIGVTVDDRLSDIQEDGDTFSVLRTEDERSPKMQNDDSSMTGVQKPAHLLVGSSLNASECAALHSLFVPSVFDDCTFTLLYRACCDGGSYDDLVRCVGDASSLVLVIRKDECLFGAYMGARLKLPDISNSRKEYKCDVWHYSLAGDSGTPIKIDIPRDCQRVYVAGREGAVHGGARMGIGGGLWLGHGDQDVGPADDVRTCILSDYVPDGFSGVRDEAGNGSPQEAGNSRLPIPTQSFKPTCLLGHILQRSHRRGRWRCGWRCNAPQFGGSCLSAGIFGSDSNVGRYRCRRCDFDLCDKCYTRRKAVRQTFVADDLEVIRVDGLSLLRPEVIEGSSLNPFQCAAIRRFLGPTRPYGPELLYKASRDGRCFGDLLRCVGDARGLVFVIRKSQYIFGACMDGSIKAPDDPTAVNEYQCDVWQFSLAGHFHIPTKMDTPRDDGHRVEVAGGEGALYCDSFLPSRLRYGRPRPQAKLTIDGRLWLGYRDEDSGPIDDMRSCRHFRSNDVPDGYLDVRDKTYGYAILGGSMEFMADELEVIHVGGVSTISSQRVDTAAVPQLTSAHPVAAAPDECSSLSHADVDQLIEWFAQGRQFSLIYRASRDGCQYGDMLDRVGGVRPIVLVIRKDTYVFGCFIPAGLREPNYPDVVSRYECHVVPFSLAGNFDGPTKIAIKQDGQHVVLAGRETAVDGMAKLWIGVGAGDFMREYRREGLCLGYGGRDSGPIDDMRSCRQPMWRRQLGFDYLSDNEAGFRGLIQDVRLGGSVKFMADELEVLTFTS